VDSSAEALKALWLSTVRRVFDKEDYRVGSHWDKTFTRVAKYLDENPSIDKEKYVAIQVGYILDMGRHDLLYPTVLSGQAAADRYYSKPMNDDLAIAAELKTYAAQLKTFNKACETSAVSVIINAPVFDFSPLFLSFMRYSRNMTVTEELRLNARHEARNCKCAEKVFPKDFLERILR
jgi:hypothetical protein